MSPKFDNSLRTSLLPGQSTVSLIDGARTTFDLPYTIYDLTSEKIKLDKTTLTHLCSDNFAMSIHTLTSSISFSVSTAVPNLLACQILSSMTMADESPTTCCIASCERYDEQPFASLTIGPGNDLPGKRRIIVNMTRAELRAAFVHIAIEGNVRGPFLSARVMNGRCTMICVK